MKSFFSHAWHSLVDWFEFSDLVPLLVLVSAVHYAAVLAGKDYWLVAVAIGLLVDLGHYRTIRAAVRYGGDDRRQRWARWLIAAGMTALSLNYHQRYYQDYWLSAPLPLLIAALAWLQQIDKRPAPKPAQDAQPKIRITAHDAPHPKALPASYACMVDGCTASFDNTQKRAAHMRWSHPKTKPEVAEKESTNVLP